MVESAAEAAGPSGAGDSSLPAAPPLGLVWTADRVRDLPTSAKAEGLRRVVRSGLDSARQPDDIGVIRSA
eukprot:14534923-Alexandrium_andersonii.AAC.1